MTDLPTPSAGRRANVFAQLLMAIAMVAVVAAGAALAQVDATHAERAKRLDALFALLTSAKDQDEGDAVVADIWKVWLQSGSADLDTRMQQVTRQMAFGELPNALAALDDIVVAAPAWAEGWNKRATVLFMLGEYDRSLADIDHVLALEPRHFGALAGIGLIRMEKGEMREALVAFRRALAVNPYLKERLGLIPQIERELGEKPL